MKTAHSQRLSAAGRLDWSRASLDSASIPAPGGEASGPNPMDRGKSGTKRHLVVLTYHPK